MTNKQWTAIVVGAFIVGILFGYAVWGPRAARLTEAEKDLATAQAQAGELKKRVADTEANLGKIANDKLTAEKELADMKEAMEKAKTKRR
jgi:type II secretory pathway component PulM